MIPLFSTEQIRKADRYAIAKLAIPGVVLMENAARSIFEAVLSRIPDLSTMDKIGFVCGKGNNGGDGFAVARHFINNGFPVRIVSLGKESELKGDAKTNFNITKNLIKQSSNSKLQFYNSIGNITKLAECILIFDAILGSGAKGSLQDPYDKIVRKLNLLNCIKVSVDIPTGLDADTGYSENCFEADLTISLAEFKKGLFVGEGYANCGEVVHGSIGMGGDYFESLEVKDYLVEPEDAYFGLPVRDKTVHKYSAGKVFTIAGSGDLPGASFFTASTVLKAGAGASILAFPQSLQILAQSKLDGSTVKLYDDDFLQYLREDNLTELDAKIKWADVVAIGPGLGRNTATVKAVQSIMKKYHAKKFVIDADALFALGKGAYKKLNLTNQILTPHYKEFADLLGIELNDLKKDVLGIGRKFTLSTKSFLVLKGAPTIIFNPAGESFVNTSGNSGMAKFGTGDVLTGIIAAFQAQSTDIESALISAVYLHGLAADLLLGRLTEFGITADDIKNEIPSAINFLRESIERIS